MVSGSNSASRTSALVTSLVQFIVSSWRNHFARSTAMKFNCFFLMPFMDEFPVYLRNELDAMYDGDVLDMFDIAETRKVLLERRAELTAECDANSKLQMRFDQISAQLRTGAATTISSSSPSSAATGSTTSTSSAPLSSSAEDSSVSEDSSSSSSSAL